MRKLLLGILLSLVAACSPLTSQQLMFWGMQEDTKAVISQLYEHVSVVNVSTRYQSGSTGWSLDLKGITNHLGNGYFVACTHVIYAAEQGSYDGYLELEKSITIDGHAAIALESERDVTILYCEYYKDEPGFVLGNMSEVRPGTLVRVIGFSDAEVFNWKMGVVSFLDLRGHYADIVTEEFFSESEMILDLTTIPGDSGSPILAMQNGQVVLIGMVSATYRNLTCVAVKSSLIQKVLKEAQAIGKGLDDEI